MGEIIAQDLELPDSESQVHSSDHPVMPIPLQSPPIKLGVAPFPEKLVPQKGEKGKNQRDRERDRRSHI